MDMRLPRRWLWLGGWISLHTTLVVLAFCWPVSPTAPSIRYGIYQERDTQGKLQQCAVDFGRINTFLKELGDRPLPRQALVISSAPRPWYFQLLGYVGMATPQWGIQLHYKSWDFADIDQIRLYHELIHYAYFSQPWTSPARLCMSWFVMPIIFFLWLAPQVSKIPRTTAWSKTAKKLDLLLLGYLCLWIIPYYLNPEEILAYSHSQAVWAAGAAPLMTNQVMDGQIPILTKAHDLSWSPSATLRPAVNLSPSFWYFNYAGRNILFWLTIWWFSAILHRRWWWAAKSYRRALWVGSGLICLYHFQPIWHNQAQQLIEYYCQQTWKPRPRSIGMQLPQTGEVIDANGHLVMIKKPRRERPPEPMTVHVDNRLVTRSDQIKKIMLIVTIVNLKKTQLVRLRVHWPHLAGMHSLVFTAKGNTLRKHRFRGGSVDLEFGWQIAEFGQVHLSAIADLREARRGYLAEGLTITVSASQQTRPNEPLSRIFVY